MGHSLLFFWSENLKNAINCALGFYVEYIDAIFLSEWNTSDNWKI